MVIDYLFRVVHAAITDLDGVSVEYLSILGNIDTTSQETNKVPPGKGPSLLICSILLSRSVVSLMKDGNLRASGCK